MKADLVILGGGPAGYTAALRAAAAGAKPVLIERGRVGGTCLHVGCIPTKTMLAGAEVLRHARRGPGFGFEVDGPRIALAGLHRRKREVVDLLAANLEASLTAKRIAIVTGEAVLAAPDRVEARTAAGAETFETGRIVLATGSRPKLPPGMAAVPGRILTSDDLVRAEAWPGSLLIVGGGVIGVEFASLLAAYGTTVTLVEALPGLLPGEDAELGRRLAQALTAAGVTVRTGDGLASLRVVAAGVEAVTTSGTALAAEAALVAVGRAPALDGVDAARLGLALERGGVRVDARMATTVPGVYAAGDATGGLQLAHVAAAQGRIAGAAALGLAEPLDLGTVPRCVYAIPEVAAVGRTEEQLKAAGVAYRKGKAVLRGNGRAQSLGEGDGFVKVLAEEASGRILGVHVIGAQASELVGEATLAVHLGLTVGAVGETIHPHPTLTEAFAEACAAVA